MRKILVLVLACFILLFSCSMDQITGFMGQMGNNVMGGYVDNDSINSIKDSTSNAETKKVEGGNAEIGNIKLSGLEVDSMLKGLSEDEMKSYVDNVASATTNEDSQKEFQKAMSEPVKDDETVKAAKGTAEVAKNALSGVVEKIGEDNSAIKNALESLQTSMDAIKEKKEVTAGDVVALQMMTSLVESVAGSATVDASGNVTGVNISKDDAAKIASDALNTVKVISAMSSATSVSLGDLTDLFNSLTAENRTMRGNIDISSEYAAVIQKGYEIYSRVFPSGLDKNSLSIMAMHKSAVDIYVSFSGDNGISDEVANISGAVQYILSSAFSVADNVYSAKHGEVFSSCPETLDGFIKEILNANKWITSSDGEAHEFVLPSSIVLIEQKDYKDIADKIVKDSSMKSMVKTLRPIAEAALGSGIEGLTEIIDKLEKVTENGIDSWK